MVPGVRSRSATSSSAFAGSLPEFSGWGRRRMKKGGFRHEGPRHLVSIDSGFWMFDTPCTQALWEAVMGENPSHFKVADRPKEGADRPVESVSWEQCQEFLTALNSRLDGVQLSLPSEAQWEYACRAGTETARYSENLDAIAWYDENSGNETHSVAGKEANSWGLYDMLGNVWEWCADVWVNDYTEKARASAAESASAHRVIRGGSWRRRRAGRAHGVPHPRRALVPAPRPGLPLCRVQAGSVSGGEGRAESASERWRSPAEPASRRDPAPRAGEASSSAGNRLHEPDRCRQRRAKDADRGAQGGS